MIARKITGEGGSEVMTIYELEARIETLELDNESLHGSLKEKEREIERLEMLIAQARENFDDIKRTCDAIVKEIK